MGRGCDPHLSAGALQAVAVKTGLSPQGSGGVPSLEMKKCRLRSLQRAHPGHALEWTVEPKVDLLFRFSRAPGPLTPKHWAGHRHPHFSRLPFLVLPMRVPVLEPLP